MVFVEKLVAFKGNSNDSKKWEIIFRPKEIT